MLPALGSKEVCRYAILPFRPGKEDLTILPQQDADSSLLREWEAKQEILEFCHIETETKNSEQSMMKWSRPSEAFVLSTDIANQA